MFSIRLFDIIKVYDYGNICVGNNLLYISMFVEFGFFFFDQIFKNVEI